MQERKVVVGGGFTNSRGKKRSERQVRRERYTQLDTEFWKIARKDKKAFLNEQCKEIEENNRMGKTRDLFKKTGEIKGTFHVRKGMIVDRNTKDLTKAEEIKKLQEYTEELYKKGLNDLITTIV